MGERPMSDGTESTDWGRASGILFLRGRLHFLLPDGTPAKANSGAPSALIAYGGGDAEMLRTCSLPGAYVDLATVVTR